MVLTVLLADRASIPRASGLSVALISRSSTTGREGLEDGTLTSSGL